LKDSSIVNILQIARIDRLIKSNSFIVSIQIQNDGLRLRMKALYNTGTDISLLINPEITIKAIKHLGAKLKTLP
jgi:hypothetical protein